VAVGSDGRSGEVIAALRLDLCLDFANTLAWRGSTPAERLHTFNDLIDWCVEAAIVSAPDADRRKAWSRKQPGRAASVLADAIILREAIFGIFGNLATAREPGREDLDRLNRALAQAPSRSAIGCASARFGWIVEARAEAAADLLAPVIWSAGDLLASHQLDRVRSCINHQCLWLFLDGSKGGSRRWCSMQACGNRAKARRYYLRRKTG
jgi:predicted RNA-binding Zn ribbon-like protein